jgi:hypothetical protein
MTFSYAKFGGLGTQGLEIWSSSSNVTASDIKTTPLTGLPDAYTHILEIPVNTTTDYAVGSVVNPNNGPGTPAIDEYVIVGFYIRFSDLSPGETHRFFQTASSANDADALATYQNGLSLTLETDGDVLVTLQSGGNETITTPFTVDTWHRVEVRSAASAAADKTVDIWVDGSSVLSVSSKQVASMAAFALGTEGLSTGTAGSVFIAGFYCLTDSTTTDDVLLDDFEILTYQNNQGDTATADADGAGTGAGTALTAGAHAGVGWWSDFADTPLSEEGTNTGYSGSGAEDGTVDLTGPSGDSDVDGDSNIRAAILIIRTYRGNGSSTTHTYYIGNSGGGVGDIDSYSLDPGTSAITTNVFTADATALPTSSELLRAGFGKSSGGREIYCHDFWGTLLHVPVATTTYTEAADLDSLLQKQFSERADLDAVLQKNDNLTRADIDSALQKQDILSRADLDAIVVPSTQTFFVDADLDAFLQKKVFVSADLDALLKANDITTRADLDAALQKSGLTVRSILDALLSYKRILPQEPT